MPPDRAHGRTVTGLVLAAITVVVLAIGLLNPMLGAVGVVVGGVLILTTWVVSRIAVPALEIVAWGASVAFGLMTVTVLALWMLSDGSHSADSAPWWIWALFAAYEVAIAVTVGGAGWHLARHIRALRLHEHGQVTHSA